MNFTKFIDSNSIHMMCDMDGVLTDYLGQFQKYVGMSLPEAKLKMGKGVYKITNNFPIEFWTTMEWLPDGKELWDYLRKNYENLYILSSPPLDDGTCKKGKTIWVKRELGLADENIIVTISKHKHIKTQDPAMSILVDDTVKKIEHWTKAGGTGILHKSAKTTIEELEKLAAQ